MIMKRRTAYIIIITTLLWISCNRQSDPGSISTYFSMEKFIGQEVETLTRNNTSIFKMASINEKEESKTQHNINWKKELAIFTSADINKPAYVGRYNVDSLASGDTIIVQFSAQSKSFSTQLIKVHKVSGEVIKLEVELRDDNLIYDAYTDLVYETGKGYTIKSKQSTVFSKERDHLIQATFN